MKVFDAISAIHDKVTAYVTALEPLVMSVSASLGCVAADDVYLAPIPETRAEVDATAVLEPVRPSLKAGSIIGPWQQSTLIAAGLAQVRVIPQPRVVVIGIGLPESSGRAVALLSTLTLTGALAMSVHVSADSEFRDAIDDQLVRADLIIICAAADVWEAVRDVCAQIGTPAEPVWSGLGLPAVQCAWLGSEQVPVVLVGQNAEDQLIAFALVTQPMLAGLSGHRLAVASTSRAGVADEAESDQFNGAMASAQAKVQSRSVRGEHSQGTELALSGITARVSVADGGFADSRSAASICVADDSGGECIIALPQPTRAGLLPSGSRG